MIYTSYKRWRKENPVLTPENLEAIRKRNDARDFPILFDYIERLEKEVERLHNQNDDDSYRAWVTGR